MWCVRRARDRFGEELDPFNGFGCTCETPMKRCSVFEIMRVSHRKSVGIAVMRNC